MNHAAVIESQICLLRAIDAPGGPAAAGKVSPDMPYKITMPQLSDTMTEGTVVKWRKSEGEKVKGGEPIADVETDKATMEMEAFESGTLALVLTKEGAKASVGAVIGVVATGSENPAEIKKQFAAGATPAKTTAVAATKPAAKPKR